MDLLTQTAADTTGARRASLWYLVQDGRLMHSANGFDCEASVHSTGLDAERSELLQYSIILPLGRRSTLSMTTATGVPPRCTA